MLPIKYSIAIRSAQPGTKKENVTETKAYPVIQLNGTMSLEEMARHMEDHNSKYNRGDIFAVIMQFCDCCAEFLKQGFKVSLGDVGTLEPTLKVTGAAVASDCSADNIKSVNIAYKEGRGVDFKDTRVSGIEFECVPSRKAQKDALTAERAKETMQPEETPGGGNGGGGNSAE